MKLKWGNVIVIKIYWVLIWIILWFLLIVIMWEVIVYSLLMLGVKGWNWNCIMRWLGVCNFMWFIFILMRVLFLMLMILFIIL